MTRILAVNGSYREGGFTDQAVGAVAQVLQEAGAEVEVVLLREHPIEFCLNCRECTQQPGSAPGTCVQHDGMQELVEKIERADGYVLAAPTNAGSATALFKRFMERLIVYTWWPWGAKAPKYRKEGGPRKKALLLSSCAAPVLIGRWAYGTSKQLRLAARTIGADPVGTVVAGLVAGTPHPELSDRQRQRLVEKARKLL